MSEDFWLFVIFVLSVALAVDCAVTEDCKKECVKSGESFVTCVETCK